MKIIFDRFENHSRHISTAGVHKPPANLFCAVIPITCIFFYATSSNWFSSGENYDVFYTFL